MNIQFEKAKKENVLKKEGWFIWGASVCKYRGKYYKFASAWEEKYSFQGWVEHSTIILAVSDSPEGPFEIKRELTELKQQNWCEEVLHNPTIMLVNDKYYLFYVGTHYELNSTKKLLENREVYRYNQQIGVAVSDNLEGLFTPYKKNPILSPSKSGWDSTYVTNPSICYFKGNYYMVYKALIEERLPDIVLNLGVAKSKDILGPYEKMQTHPLMENNIEDPFVWCDKEYFYMVVKDMTGETIGAVDEALILKSKDILKWDFAKCRKAYDLNICWENVKKKYKNVERPQIYFEKGIPICLYNAVRTYDNKTFNISRKIIMKE